MQSLVSSAFGWRQIAIWLCALALGGCALSVHNLPSNQALPEGDLVAPGPARNIAGQNLVALSFSGGGMRAAAFSFGVLKALQASSSPSGDWALTADGPSGLDAALAATDTAIDSAAHIGFDAFHKMMHEWQSSVVEFRCGLPPTEVRRLRGSTDGWDCQDLQFHFGLVSFADVGPEREAQLNAIPTRLSLPRESVDAAIQAGFDATRGSATLRTYLSSTQDRP